jgi:hypothetical protein
MRVEYEPAQVCFLQDIFKSRRVSAFGQPESGGLRLKRFAKQITADQNLRANRFARLLQERQKSVCCSGSDQLKRTVFVQRGEGGKQIAFPIFSETLPTFTEARVIELG